MEADKMQPRTGNQRSESLQEFKRRRHDVGRAIDGRVLQLVQGFLDQDIMEGLQRWKPNAGTPQGAVVSPLLANLYLHSLDVEMTAAGCKIVRYADDFVVLRRSREEAEAALAQIRAWAVQNALRLHPEKTIWETAWKPGTALTS